MQGFVPILIPAYEPDQRLITLMASLKDYPYGPVIIVNDGSGKSYDSIFTAAGRYDHVIVLKHKQNKGKGAGIKTGLTYISEHLKEAIGCVTADSDGQHLAADIEKVAAALIAHPDHLILGVRDFHLPGIPSKSRFGNVLTCKTFHLVTGKAIKDTQTGLRGIPRSFFKSCLNIKENRFEYEMRMLLCKDCPDFYEVPIHTIYESETHHQTHFNPVKDSIRIYRILLGQFVRYTLSSLSSSLIDIALFALFSYILKGQRFSIAEATVLARICSAIYNFMINKKVVYQSEASYRSSSLRYLILAIAQMLCSATLTSLGAYIFTFIPTVIIKVIVDTCLFFISYRIQKKYIFT